MKRRLPVDFSWLPLILAALPLALFMLLGHYSRLMSDDYCAIAVGQELGAWDGMRYWYNSWAGSYANFFFKSAIAPLDTLVPAITPTLIIALCWLAGLWLAAQILPRLGIQRARGSLSALISAAVLAAVINGLHSPQSFYWFAASTHYTLPMAALAGWLGLMIWAAQRRRRASTIVAAGAGFGLCFVCGGASEIFVLFQVVLLTFCALPVMIAIRQRVAGPFLLIYAAGGLASLIAFFLQLSSPGLADRAATDAALMGLALRSLPELITGGAAATIKALGHAPLFAGFMLLLALGLLAADRNAKARAASLSLRLGIAPLALGLILQLLWLPIIFSHISDDAQFLGRYSGGYLSVVVINLLLTLAFPLLLHQRDRIQGWLSRNPGRASLAAALILLIIALIFGLTQIRSIHDRAGAYLFTTALSLLTILAWQLRSGHAGARANLSRWMLLYALIAAIASLAAIVVAALFGRGFVDDRILAPALFLLLTPGLFFGAYLGSMLARTAAACHGSQAAWRAIMLGCAGLAFVISLGMMLGQASHIPDFRAYADAWDQRHQQILAQRESGATAITVAALPFDLADYVNITNLARDPANRCALRYYGVESISLAGG